MQGLLTYMGLPTGRPVRDFTGGDWRLWRSYKSWRKDNEQEVQRMSCRLLFFRFGPHNHVTADTMSWYDKERSYLFPFHLRVIETPIKSSKIDTYDDRMIFERNVYGIIKVQWSLWFKTPLFNISLHFKTVYQWHHLYIFSINIPLF